MMARRRLWLAAVVVAVAGGEDDALACPCGLGDAPWPERGPQDLALHYLHVPKAGTSWAVTMARVPAACGGVSSSGLASAMRACVAAGTNLQETCMFEVLQSRSRKCMRAAASVRRTVLESGDRSVVARTPPRKLGGGRLLRARRQGFRRRLAVKRSMRAHYPYDAAKGPVSSYVAVFPGAGKG